MDREENSKCSGTLQREGDENESCGRCFRTVSHSDKGVQCDECCQWYHSKCGGIKDSDYRIITQMDDFDWYCSDCKETMKKRKTEIEQLHEENQKLKEENQLLKERLAVLAV